jgi:hypothetical protein
MTSTSSPTVSHSYSVATVHRAELAVRCAPFLLPLFVALRSQGVSLRAIAGPAGVGKQYTRSVLSELMADNALSWLIQVGLLRREVDGQGLTDSFRLTPLGRQLVAQWEASGFPPPPTPFGRLKNLLNRWLRRPDWFQ